MSPTTPPLVATAPAAGERAPTGGIVVGVDGSTGSAAALRWAIDEARRRDAPLVAVHAWQPTRRAALPHGAADTGGAEELLAAALAAEDTAGVAVRPVATRAAASAALLAAAAGAALLVVGARGAGGFPGLHLGAVSRRIARHAPCPTVVVPRAHRSVPGPGGPSGP